MSVNQNQSSSFIQTINKVPFILQVVIGLVLGIIAAAIYPDDKTIIPTFGSLFVTALKSIAPILVFVLVSSAIAKHRSDKKTAIKPIIVLYIVSMVLAGFVALCLSYMFPSEFPGLVASGAESAAGPKGIGEVLVNFINQAVANPVDAFIKGNYVAILLWAVLLGIMFRGAHENTKRVLDDLSACVSGVIRMVIRCAPLGVFGLVYNSCTQDGGFANLLNYVQVVCVLVGAMAVVAFVTNPLVVFLTTHENPYPLLFKCLAKSGVTAFFTRSSAANLPVNLALCEELKLDKATYSISIPLGCTINMCGAAITIVIMTMGAANTVGIETAFISAFFMCIISILGACGCSGVAGGSLMIIPLACSIFGISNDIAMQVVGIGFIIGVVQDSCETALNSSTDVLFTAAACKREERLAKNK